MSVKIIIAIAVLASVTVLSSSSFAASGMRRSIPVHGPDPCTSICGNPGNPDNPGDPKDPGVPGLPSNLALSYQVCGDKLGQLHKVTVGQVQSVDSSDYVKVVPLCDNRGRSLSQADVALIDRGNVEGLVVAIADNEAMTAELQQARYQANDVIGIAVHGPAAVLYVHKR